MRIALIHALKHSLVPIEASFARLWPDASLMNLLDDSLSADVAREGREQARLRQAVAIYAVVPRLRPGFVEIAERGTFLLVIG